MNYVQIFAILILSQSCTSERTGEENSNSPSNFYLQATRKPQFISATDEEIKFVRSAQDSIKINYGYSFGACEGYCERNIEFSSKGLLIANYNWKRNNTITTFSSIEDSTYNSLINAINFESFTTFNEYLGCGDCSDGGSETIEIIINGKRKVRSGTFGFSLKCVQLLLDYLRAVKN